MTTKIVEKEEVDTRPIGFFPCTENPPMFGTTFILFNISKSFSKIYIGIYDNPTYLPTDSVVKYLKGVYNRFTDKFEIIKIDTDFANCNSIPSTLPEFDILITNSNKIVANMLSKGCNFVQSIPNAVGWDQEMHAIAFNRSIILNQIKNRRVII